MNVATIVLDTHLTLDQLEGALASVSRNVDALIVDCRTMTGYDHAARSRFVEWNREHRVHITRVAVVTEKSLWHMIIAAMALASQQDMKAFSTMEPAVDWARR